MSTIEPDAAVRVPPFCADLASKKSFFLGRPAFDEDELLDASRHAWCRRTMQAIGPDKEVVDPSDCRLGRSCFRAIL